MAYAPQNMLRLEIQTTEEKALDVPKDSPP